MDPNTDQDKKYFDIAKPKPNPSGAPVFKSPKRQMINIENGQKPPEESAPISNEEENNLESSDTLIEPDEAFEPSSGSNALSHPDLKVPDHIDKDTSNNIETKDETVEQSRSDEDVPFVDPLPGTIEEKIIETKSEDEDKESKTDTPEAGDSKASEEKAEDQQQNTSQEDLIETKKNDDAQNNQATEPELSTPSPERFYASDALPEPSNADAQESKEAMQDPKIYDTKEYYVPIGNTHHSHGGLKMAFVFGILCAAVVLGAVFYYVMVMGK